MRFFLPGCSRDLCISELALKQSFWHLAMLLPPLCGTSGPTCPREEAQFAFRARPSSGRTQGVHTHSHVSPMHSPCFPGARHHCGGRGVQRSSCLSPLVSAIIPLPSRAEDPAIPTGLFSRCAGRERAAGVGSTCSHSSQAGRVLWDTG